MFRACFAGDMLLDAEGGKKRADAIQVGDRLWARDESDPAGLLALKEVEEVFVRSAPLWNLHVAGQRLKTTAEHPFYVVGQGWVPAGMLQIGDRLLTQDGRAVPVEGVAPSGQRATVFNWRIAEYHTYYVSDDEGAESIWAHNTYNVHGGSATPEQALEQGEQWLGPGYREIAPGVYRSADNARQFRMTDSDLMAPDPHVHFKAIGPDGREIIENSHLYLH
jgi:hypothetical protein